MSVTRSRFQKCNLYPYFYILPGMMAMFLAVTLPGIITIFYSFTNFSLTHLSDWSIIGFENFKRILLGSAQKEFLGVFAWTLGWATLSTFLSYSIGLILALLLNNKHLPERNLYRLILILPWALPSTITILTWKGLFNSSFGPVNRFIAEIFSLNPIPWLLEPGWARITCLLVNLWLAFPFMMVACLGALQGIPEELYDASKVDGANSFQSFRYITLPLLRSITMPLVICGFAMQFGNFGVIYLLTEGGPFMRTANIAGATDLLATYMYKMAFGSANFDFGLAAANGVVLFIIVGGLTLLNSLLTGAFREVEE